MASSHYDRSTPAVVIDALAITHPAVCTEALRWSTGARGPAVSADDLEETDLVGSRPGDDRRRAGHLGGRQHPGHGEPRAAHPGRRHAHDPERDGGHPGHEPGRGGRCQGGQGRLRRAAQGSREAAEASRRSFGDSVSVASEQLKRALTELLGGDDPQLLQRVTPVLDKAATRMARLSAEQTDTMLAKLTRQFDPADPTSPFAKQVKVLEEPADGAGRCSNVTTCRWPARSTS